MWIIGGAPQLGLVLAIDALLLALLAAALCRLLAALGSHERSEGVFDSAHAADDSCRDGESGRADRDELQSGSLLPLTLPITASRAGPFHMSFLRAGPRVADGVGGDGVGGDGVGGGGGGGGDFGGDLA
eukprot:3057736-Prymnesium_polylepis.1